MPIGADADASFAQLGTAIAAAVPFTAPFHAVVSDRLNILDNSPDHTASTWSSSAIRGWRCDHPPDLAAIGSACATSPARLTYVEHESGEVELYDLRVDPAQLENKADDPAYAGTAAGPGVAPR